MRDEGTPRDAAAAVNSALRPATTVGNMKARQDRSAAQAAIARGVKLLQKEARQFLVPSVTIMKNTMVPCAVRAERCVSAMR